MAKESLIKTIKSNRTKYEQMRRFYEERVTDLAKECSLAQVERDSVAMELSKMSNVQTKDSTVFKKLKVSGVVSAVFTLNPPPPSLLAHPMEPLPISTLRFSPLHPNPTHSTPLSSHTY